MKRNAYIAAALLFAGFTACNSEPAFKVQGEVTDAADKMLYLEQTGLDGIVALDSVELGSDGAFSFAALKGCYSEKTGKTYDAVVLLEDDGQRTGYKMVFDNG